MVRISDEHYTPVLIVGTGISGLAVAYHLSKKSIEYKIVTKSSAPKQSNSFLSAANTRVPSEHELHATINLTVDACGADRSVIEALYKNSNHVMELFEDLGLPYEKTSFGFMPESSIKSHGGKKLINRILEKIDPPICNHILIHVEKSKAGFSTLFYDIESDQFSRIHSNYLVLATGGFSAQFNYNDNSPGSTGEALILAKQMGARLKGMSTVMYHPWSIYNGRQILLGGVVSLCKGRIVDDDGVPLLANKSLCDAIARDDYHEMIDDILKIQLECLKRNKEMYLDMRHVDEDVLNERMKRYGFSTNIIKQKRINISPTMHYTSGGIEINSNAEAIDLHRVFVAGEAQFNGTLGSGRIPGQAYASGIVFGKLIADKIAHDGGFSTQVGSAGNIPTEMMTLYAKEQSDCSIEAYQKDLSNLMIDLIASPTTTASLAFFKESLLDGQRHLLKTARGSGKRYEEILKLYFGYSIGLEMIEDLERKHQQSVRETVNVLSA